jgi:hypothetical protein
MTILFNFASRSRPDKFFETLDNIVKNCASNDYLIVCKLDEDDATMTDAYVRRKLLTYPKIIVKWGASTSKIHAINRGLNDGDLPKWDILVNVSDDMRFKTYGFDDIIRKYMPENLDAFLHFPDDYAKERVCTCSIIGFRYYQRDMRVYWPGYYSMWSDDEETDKAKARGCYIFIPDAIEIDHLHYTNMGKATKDALYRRNDTYLADKKIYEERKLRNFDL